MHIGFDIVAAKRDKTDAADAPSQERMRASVRPADRRNPSTDEKKARRQQAQQAKKTASEESSMTTTPDTQPTEASLLHRMATATSLDEQRSLAVELEQLRARRTASVQADRALDLSATAAERTFETLAPAHFTQHTAATDWLGEIEDDSHDIPAIEAQMRAEANLWFSNLYEPVKGDAEEFRAQAEGRAQRLAGKHGAARQQAEGAFLDQVAHLARTEKIAFDEVQKPPYGVPNGSSLPAGVKNKDTFDADVQWPGNGEQSEQKTDPSMSPSLQEGDKPEGDTAEDPTSNPVADSNDHAKDSKDTTFTDYIDGTKTPNTKSSAKTAVDDAYHEIARGGDPKSTTNKGQTPSLDEGDQPEGDHKEPVVEPQRSTTYDAGPGNGPTKDYLNGQQYSWPNDSKAASLQMVATSLASRPHEGNAAVFVAGFEALASRAQGLDGDINGIGGRELIALLMQTVALTDTERVALERHLAASDTGNCGLCGAPVSYDKDSRKWYHDEDEGKDHEAKSPHTAAKTAGPYSKTDFKKCPHCSKNIFANSSKCAHCGKKVSSKTAAGEARPLYEIAAEIRADWKNVYFGAVPYLEALGYLNTIDDSFGDDGAKSVIAYFLSNAKTWQGETARRVKKELKTIMDSGGSWFGAGQMMGARVLKGWDAVTAGVKPGTIVRQAEDSSGGNTCAVCGDKIAKDPSSEDPSTWHHDNGEKHDHEAKPKVRDQTPGGKDSAWSQDKSARKVSGWEAISAGVVRPFVGSQQTLATRYCPTHKVYVGPGNQENHDHCPVETRKKKSSSLKPVTAATVKAIIIHPDKRIIERTVSGLSDLQGVVGGSIEPVSLKGDVTMWVNEDYLYAFDNSEVNWIATDVCGLGGRPEFMFRQPIKGPVVLVGPPVNGEDTDVTDDAKRWVQRVAREAGGKWSTASKTADGPTNTFPCKRCGATVERWKGEYDVNCPNCGTPHNAGGQELRSDYAGNPSMYDDEIGDMEGYEMQHAHDASRRSGHRHLTKETAADCPTCKGTGNAPPRNDFSISDAKNEDGEWIMSPEQIRAEQAADEYDRYERDQMHPDDY